MPVRQTSIDTYRDIIAEGTVGDQAQKIALYIADRHDFPSRKVVSEGTGIAINAVAGRVNELIKAGLVEETIKVKCPITKRTVWGLGATKP